MDKPLYVISEEDNVAVALREIAAGEDGAVERIPVNFKTALRDIKKGESIVKYGFPIGAATRDIKRGECVHTHNFATQLSSSGLKHASLKSERANKTSGETPTFEGYLRPNGSAGIRNEIFVLPMVGCVNDVCGRIAERAISETGFRDIFVMRHPYGCSQLGGDLENTKRILRNLALHPNAGGVLVVALGCENNTLPEFKALLSGYDPERIRFMTAQDGGDEIERGAKEIAGLVKLCNSDRRQSVPLSKLVVGLKCGGSDALSGVTANPLVGRISKRLENLGGSIIMTEVPEMFGAEELLFSHCESEEVLRRAERMISEFKQYFTEHGEPVSENPSPGNREGGITTLEEKSLGCVQKGGGARITDVLEYGGQVKKPGLSLLNGPGNDIVAQTALAAAGAQIILFTTGRGTPLGAPVPTLKISTNSALCLAKPQWIDCNAGVLVENTQMKSAEDELFELILETASGKKTKNEINGYRDVAIWKGGVTL